MIRDLSDNQAIQSRPHRFGPPATYRVVHETRYQYSEPVAICQNELRMRPQSTTWLKCHDCRIEIQPHPAIVQTHQDYFGNVVDCFALEVPHQSLLVRVTSRVTVASRTDEQLGEGPLWQDLVSSVRSGDDPSNLFANEYVFRSRRIDPQPIFADYAKPIFEQKPHLLAGVEELTRRIHQDFRYDGAATTVLTTTRQAFDLRAGVCQDFSHIQIACLRSLGIPARYVSGYLRTLPPAGQPRLVGADQSHAWVSVYAGEKIGWVDYDPTNACRTGVDHIPVCIGRDYDDISPMRGIVLGGGGTTLSVSVDVAPDPVTAAEAKAIVASIDPSPAPTPGSPPVEPSDD